mmetsp:Transcript_13886/g.21649  ORF Transcript_13886/g.21649 Transcript_13886/m.21649 type:complete len:1278 (-) Transcript_13886:121-3954(-)
MPTFRMPPSRPADVERPNASRREMPKFERPLVPKKHASQSEGPKAPALKMTPEKPRREQTQKMPDPKSPPYEQRMSQFERQHREPMQKMSDHERPQQHSVQEMQDRERAQQQPMQKGPPGFERPPQQPMQKRPPGFDSTQQQPMQNGPPGFEMPQRHPMQQGPDHVRPQQQPMQRMPESEIPPKELRQSSSEYEAKKREGMQNMPGIERPQQEPMQRMPTQERPIQEPMQNRPPSQFQQQPRSRDNTNQNPYPPSGQMPPRGLPQHPNHGGRYPPNAMPHQHQPRQGGPPNWGGGASPPTQQKPRLKSLWRFVEQGLDDLANLEDQVASRAKRMMRQGEMLTKSAVQQARTIPVKKMVANPVQQVKNVVAANRPARAASTNDAAVSPAQRLDALLGDRSNKYTPLDKMNGTTGGSQPGQEQKQQGNIQRQSLEQMRNALNPETRRGPQPSEQPSASARVDPRTVLLSGHASPTAAHKGQPMNENRLTDSRNDGGNKEGKGIEQIRVHRRISNRRHRHSLGSFSSPLPDLLSRLGKNGNQSLLSPADIKQCRSIGRSRAVMDFASVGFICISMRRLVQWIADAPMASPLSGLDTWRSMGEAILLSLNTWTCFAFIAAYLYYGWGELLSLPKIHELTNTVGTSLRSSALFGQLYLHFFSSSAVQKKIPEKIYTVASAQIASTAALSRLRCFVLMVLTSSAFLMMPSMNFGISDFSQFATKLEAGIKSLKDFESISVDFAGMLQSAVSSFQQLLETLISKFDVQLGQSFSPSVAFQTAAFASIVLLALVPSRKLQRKKNISSSRSVDETDSIPFFGRKTDQVVKPLSRATRLNLLSFYGSVERFLDKCGVDLPSTFKEAPDSHPRYLPLKILGGLVALFVSLGGAAIVCYVLAALSSSTQAPANRIFDPSLMDLSIWLLFTMILRWNFSRQRITDNEDGIAVESFLSTLDETVDDVALSQQSPQGNVQLAALLSADKGLSISDLWVAHTAKRAWAVRGASTTCRAGEVVMLLGDPGAGKTLFLTTLGEAIISSPKKSRSTSKVRGSISIGGVDVSKWDPMQLKKKLGMILNDVSTSSDIASLSTGNSLGEILEPTDRIGLSDQNEDAARAANAISVAVEMSGLSSSLLPRLPAKFATTITLDESKSDQSNVATTGTSLSPAEWSKTILTKVLAQAIFDNPAQGGKKDDLIKNCLRGSLLILDDVTSYTAENEEAQILKTLKHSGAAAFLTSRRWTAGQFADRVIVMKDGAIIESGTHEELLALGPQRSTYAAKWHALSLV